jgi:hypothetical protein
MSGFPIVDLVIGMIFIFFLLSIICSSGVELWFAIRRTRARLLEEWLKTIFNKQALNSRGLPVLDKNNNPVTVGQAIIDHCITTATAGEGKTPTYINTQNFISALLDKITLEKSNNASPDAPVQLPPTKLQEYIDTIAKSELISGELKRTILMLAHEAKEAANAINTIPVTEKVTATVTNQIKSEMEHFRDRLALWYDKNGERLTGEFKRKRVLPATFVFALLITVLMNADSVAIGKYLYKNKDLSQQLAEQAMTSIAGYSQRVAQLQDRNNDTDSTDTVSIDQLNQHVAQLRGDIRFMNDSLAANIPLGWKDGNVQLSDWKKHAIGWLASILAICLGAPFWFDLLNKIANLRGSGRRPATDSDRDR